MVDGGGTVGTAVGIGTGVVDGPGVGNWPDSTCRDGTGVGNGVEGGGALAHPTASTKVAAAHFTGAGPLREWPAVPPGSHVREVRVGGTSHAAASGFSAIHDR